MSLLECVEVPARSSASASVIWLHGLGADGHDFEPVVPELGAAIRDAVRFVFPHAPVRPVTINAGYEMRAWYDIYELGRVHEEDDAGIRESEKRVRDLVDREVGRGIEPSRILLAGFSQGGAIALHTGLRHPTRLAGIIALSTYLPLASTLTTEATEANRDVPIFLAHGRGDPVLGIALAEQSRAALESAGYAPSWHEYAMPHSVCAEEIHDLAAWMRGTLELS